MAKKEQKLVEDKRIQQFMKDSEGPTDINEPLSNVDENVEAINKSLDAMNKFVRQNK